MSKIILAAVAAASLALVGCAQHDQAMPVSNTSQSGYSSKLGTTHHHRRVHKTTTKAAPASTTTAASTTTTTATTDTSTSN